MCVRSIRVGDAARLFVASPKIVKAERDIFSEGAMRE